MRRSMRSPALSSNSLEYGVRVLAVSPGAVETKRLVTLMKTRAETERGDAGRWHEFVSGFPRGRPATVEEVANVVAFAASDRACYLSGIVIMVDGGRNAWRRLYPLGMHAHVAARALDCFTGRPDRVSIVANNKK